MPHDLHGTLKEFNPGGVNGAQKTGRYYSLPALGKALGVNISRLSALSSAGVPQTWSDSCSETECVRFCRPDGLRRGSYRVCRTGLNTPSAPCHVL